MRFASLGSGSKGNATLIEAGDIRVLVDCGFAAKELERRLAELAVDPSSLNAILVTHEHGDHLRGVGPVARRYQIPVWMTAGTLKTDRCGQLPELNLINSHADDFSIGALRVIPFPVPHDAREPCQFSFVHDEKCFTLLTDLGQVTPHVLHEVKRCDALLLECNHDLEMLANGPYPPSVQARVSGAFGHLSNCQATELLLQIESERLSHLVVAHLSQQNNTPERVRETILESLPELESRLTVVQQEGVSRWFEC
ncbi:MAG: MBL fold metallo-hydrolase [Candidatus Polarisedimenticolaceae bacterium]|nr:MBL fold metallo-hydrolase [Candidatus Polarisedimenticolaceae bacterium]